jgi:glycosyltransferase involved in cell wall biosynthesis
MIKTGLVLISSGQIDYLDHYLSQIQTHLNEMGRFSLVVVDNGSMDCQDDIFRSTVSKYPFAKSAVITRNRGNGFAALVGLSECRDAERIGWAVMDDDTPPDALCQFIKDAMTIESPLVILADVKRPPLREWVQMIWASLRISFRFRTWIWDPIAVPMLFPQSLFQQIRNAPHSSTLALYIRLAAKSLMIGTIRVSMDRKNIIPNSRFFRESGIWRDEWRRQQMIKSLQK